MNKPRAAFFVVEVMPDKVFLIDESDQKKTVTVTNDAEAVCAQVHNRHPGKRIIYRDTAGHWDEIVHAAGRFETFKPYTPPKL